MKTTAINKIGLSECTGCYACYNVCQYDAITMVMTADGFYKPHITEEKCIECGMCAKKCPVLDTDYNNKKEPDFFMAWSMNRETRKNSSSGGMFSEIAKNILKEGGKVYGVVWDENFELEHIKVDSLEKLLPLRGSKYLQSKVNKSYLEIKDILENSVKKVLFVGTPCQVAGLKKIVENDRLLTCDLLCHGIPSYISFKSYLSSLNDRINEVNFRDKITGWTNYSITLRGEKDTYSKPFTKDRFFMGFLRDYYLNEACYNCKFSVLPRQGDITLGDFWGISKEYDRNNEGVSVVLANNKKGYEVLISLAKSEDIELEKVEKIMASKSNPRIYSGKLLRPEKRDYIISDIKKFGFNRVAKREIRIFGGWQTIKAIIRKVEGISK